MDDISAFVSDDVTREHFVGDVVPPHGFIERFELTPSQLLPNMDAKGPYRLRAELVAPNGGTIPLDVVVISRGVKRPEEMVQHG